MPKLVAVERDYPAVAEKMAALGPLVESAGIGAKGVAWKPSRRSPSWRGATAAQRRRPGRRPPVARRDVDVCEAILALSGTTNGRLAVEGFRALEPQTGLELADVPSERADDRLTFGDIAIQPRKVIASAEWSGLESRDRRYSPFTANVELLIPWRTLTGRQQLYVDHAWMLELGEGLPAYRPPVDAGQLDRSRRQPDAGDGARGHGPLPDPALEVVDPLRVPGQPHDADPVPRRAGDVARARGRREDRRRRQRLGRGLQPQRRRRLPRRRLAPGPRGRRRSCTTRRTAT